jgi:hypothetical protein
MEPNKEAAKFAIESGIAFFEKKKLYNYYLGELVKDLAVLAPYVEPREAATAAAEAAALLLHEMRTSKQDDLGYFVNKMPEIVAYMDPKERKKTTAEAVALLAHAISQTPNSDEFASTGDLTLRLTTMAPRMDSKGVAQAAARFCDDEQIGEADKAELRPAYAKLLFSLEIADLVELLKQPLCVRDLRRLVLDELGKRHKHHFGDQWDFVRFAEEHRFGFDLAGPPTFRQSSESSFP